ncbi:MAG: ADP-ribosylglycohydrolase family protein [Bacteroides sp.]|nr:ADP-ribosylglycohydrolase family protein [Bacteroides sp.]
MDEFNILADFIGKFPPYVDVKWRERTADDDDLLSVIILVSGVDAKFPENRLVMLGAIVGDRIGSTYEFIDMKRYDFDMLPQGSCFTDDTVMTIAVAHWR